MGWGAISRIQRESFCVWGGWAVWMDHTSREIEKSRACGGGARSKKRKGAKIKSELTLDDVKSFIKTPQIRRSSLSICNTVDDSLRLASPQVMSMA